MTKKVREKSGIANRLKQYRIDTDTQQIELAKKLGIVPTQLSKYENGISDPSAKILEKYGTYTDINLNWLLTGEGAMLKSGICEQKTEQDTCFIPYWDECPIVSEKLKKPTIKEGFPIGTDIVINEWNCDPKNARLISTPGEDMDGGQYPIRNKDLLVIDISKNEITDSGIYLITTQAGTIVMLRRLMELADGSVAFYIDNKEYSFAVNKTYTREELIAMDFKVIGRVVKNVTYTL